MKQLTQKNYFLDFENVFLMINQHWYFQSLKLSQDFTF